MPNQKYQDRMSRSDGENKVMNQLLFNNNNIIQDAKSEAPGPDGQIRGIRSRRTTTKQVDIPTCKG